jgi:hypothetical protein
MPLASIRRFRSALIAGLSLALLQSGLASPTLGADLAANPIFVRELPLPGWIGNHRNEWVHEHPAYASPCRSRAAADEIHFLNRVIAIDEYLLARDNDLDDSAKKQGTSPHDPEPGVLHRDIATADALAAQLQALPDCANRAPPTQFAAAPAETAAPARARAAPTQAAVATTPTSANTAAPMPSAAAPAPPAADPSAATAETAAPAPSIPAPPPVAAPPAQVQTAPPEPAPASVVAAATSPLGTAAPVPSAIAPRPVGAAPTLAEIFAPAHSTTATAPAPAAPPLAEVVAPALSNTTPEPAAADRPAPLVIRFDDRVAALTPASIRVFNAAIAAAIGGKKVQLAIDGCAAGADFSDGSPCLRRLRSLEHRLAESGIKDPKRLFAEPH